MGHTAKPYLDLVCKRCALSIPKVRPSRKHNKLTYCSVLCANRTITSRQFSVPIGHISKGYAVTSLPYEFLPSGRRRFRPKHVLIAERAIGHKLPPGAVVHHHDENRLNNANSNLVVCESHAYHKLIHARTRILWAGGDPDTEQLCHHCKQIKPRTGFHPVRSKWNGVGSLCRDCASSSNKKRWKESIKRGRPRGEANPAHRLTSEAVIQIRQRYAAGDISQNALAKEYFVSTTTINGIVRGRFWRNQ